MRLLAFFPLPVIALLGYTIGSIAYTLPFTRRDLALRNLQACFPEKRLTELKRINFKQFCYLGQSILITPMNWWISEKRFARFTQVVGREDYDAALAEGKNIILLTPHFLAIEVSGLYLQRERNMIGVYQYMKNSLMDEIAKSGRSRYCDDGLMFERKQPLRTLLRWIRKGLPMSYSPDQDAGRKGVFVPFFHPLSSTTPALAKFIATTHSVVIPCTNEMLPWGQGYRVTLGKRIPNLHTNNELEDTAAMNRAIEKMVRVLPEQYLWVHKRFKTRPEGEQAFYN